MGEEHELWEHLGLKPQPFMNVRYLLPWGKETQTTGVPNCFGEPPDQFQTYAYSLRDVIGDGANPGPSLSLIVRVPDPWDTLGALIGEIQQGIGNNEPKWQGVNTWGDVLNKKPLMDQGIPQKFGEVAASSVGRFVRVLRRVTKNRQSGVFVEQRNPRKAANLGEEIRKIPENRFCERSLSSACVLKKATGSVRRHSRRPSENPFTRAELSHPSGR